MGSVYGNYVGGNGHTLSMGILESQASQFLGCAPWTTAWHWDNLTFTYAGYAVIDRSAMAHGQMTTALTNTVGPSYIVSGNSIFYQYGQQAPGNASATADTQGQVLP